jgi:hypothetical protein
LSIELLDPFSHPQEGILHNFLGHALIMGDQECGPDGFDLILPDQEFQPANILPKQGVYCLLFIH